jgi:hypothetical protein
MRLERKPVTAWAPGSLVWSTQFNDLRTDRSMGSDPAARRQRLNIELRTLALLAPRTVIRDADVVNHIDLLHMLERNSGGVRAAFECGALVFGIRDAAASLSEVNEQAGENRAFPERYQEAKEKLSTVDEWLTGKKLTLVETATTGRDTFNEHLNVILDSGRLSSEDEDLLRSAIDAARRSSVADAPLRFGHVLSAVKAGSASAELVQWCRAAHVLIAPKEHGLPPSTANQDLRPDIVSLLCRRTTTSPKLTRRWTDMYPKRILTEDALLSLSFNDIAHLRSKVDPHYFKAAMNVQLAFGTPGFEHAYGDYLAALADYIETIGADHSTEMVDWQKALLDQRVAVEEERAKVLLWSIPILATRLLEFVTMSLFPGMPTMLTTAGERVRSIREKMGPNALLRLQRGTTVTPVDPS